MASYLSTSQARKLTGKSESTIKRMVREIVSNPDHPDRGLVRPSHDEVQQLRASQERYTWSIAEELLRRRFPPETEARANGDQTPEPAPSTDAVLEVLRDQLGKKDEQIRALENQLNRKDEQFAILSERQRESNILMKSLQERLALEPTEKKRSWFSSFLRP